MWPSRYWHIKGIVSFLWGQCSLFFTRYSSRFTKFEGNKSEHLGQLLVTPEMIAKKIKKMKDNNSPGVDEIPPKLLKKMVEQISTPLAKVFNLSIDEGIVPSEWKKANITSLFQNGSRNKPENYRPVSLTSVICKLLETLIRDHTVEFLVKYKLIKNISTWVPKSKVMSNQSVFGRNYKVGRWRVTSGCSLLRFSESFR